MIKKLLSTVALVLVMVSAAAVAQVKVGYLNTQEVLSELPEREQVQNELDTFIQQKQTELSEQAAAYQEEVAAYESNQASMTPEQREQREQELTETLTSLEEFNQSIRLQIQQKREELLAPIFEKIDNAISAIAEGEGLDFVLNKSTNTGDSVIFYASNNQKDITRQVINELTSSTQ